MATATLNVPQVDGRAGGRGVEVRWIALLVAALFAALASIYFGVNAGTDYPEPGVQMID